MTNQEAIKILDNLKPGDYSNPYEKGEAIVMAIEALQVQDEEQREEPLYCDRDICLRNEYNGIGCEECEVTKSQKNLQQVTTDTISRQAAIDTVEGFDILDGYTDQQELIRRIIQLPSEPQWIPVSERMPKERDKFYQATYLLDNGDRIVDYVYFNSKGMWSNYAYEYSELLAWMPLPEPYREESEE